jgi:hypothetical protein
VVAGTINSCLAGNLDTSDIGADTNVGRVGHAIGGVGNSVVRGLGKTDGGGNNGVVGIGDSGGGNSVVSIGGIRVGTIGLGGIGVSAIGMGIGVSAISSRVEDGGVGLGISLTLHDVLNGTVLGDVAGAEKTVGGGGVLLGVVVVGDGVAGNGGSNDGGGGVGYSGSSNGSVGVGNGSGNGVVDSRAVHNRVDGVVGGDNGGGLSLLNLNGLNGLDGSNVGVGQGKSVGIDTGVSGIGVATIDTGVSGIGVATIDTGVSGIRVGTIGRGVEKSGIGFRLGCHKGTQSENYEHLHLHFVMSLV